MATERHEVVVVGGGQAGLAMSRHLGAEGIDHVVLERARIAERWRTGRWDSLVANGPAAVRACKKLVQDVAGREIDAALRDETARRIADIRASDEGREGIASFLNKRAPNWLV